MTDGQSKPTTPTTYVPLTVDDGNANADAGNKKLQPLSALFQAGVLTGVIVLGCADVISRQIVAKSLKRFSYMLSLSTTLAYLPLYCMILGALIKMKIVPKAQLDWAWSGKWCQGWKAAPYVKFYAIAALGDALGDTFGYICSPYVAGPIHSLLAQCTTMFTVMLSFCILKSRYSFWQCLGLVGVEIGVVVGVIPSLGEGENSTNAFFAALLGGSCFFNAAAFVAKELSFGIYEQKPPPEVPNSTLNIFIVNSHESLFQLPLTLLLVPLARATGQTEGEGTVAYLQEGIRCFQGDITEHSGCQYASRWTLVYVFFNICWNLIILLNVKVNGSLSTFVALKVVFPLSAVLFAYVDWPLLDTTPVASTTWIALVCIMPFTFLFMWASIAQKERSERGEATCCWPLKKAKASTIVD